ncbi:hypothetical protein K1719_028801 [Acacia pycnantha]|nr:hypothetical protein K1719_028801 [Acacia pycnantha]
MWAKKGVVSLINIGHGFYMARLSNKEDYINALTGGPWMIYNHYLTMRPWEPNFLLARAKIDKKNDTGGGDPPNPADSQQQKGGKDMNAHQDQWNIFQRNRRPHKAKESGDGMPKQDHKGSYFKVLAEMEARGHNGSDMGKVQEHRSHGEQDQGARPDRKGTNAREVEEHSGKVKRVEKRARGIRNAVLSTISFNGVSKEGTGGEILREKGLASSESTLVIWAPNEDGAIPMAHTEAHNLDPVCNGIKPKLIILAETKSQSDAPFRPLLAGGFNVCEFIPSDGRFEGIAILWKNNGTCETNQFQHLSLGWSMGISMISLPPHNDAEVATVMLEDAMV